MANDPTEDVIATAEGDNEILPDEPLEPSSDAAVDGLETPPGSGDLPYKKDKNEQQSYGPVLIKRSIA